MILAQNRVVARELGEGGKYWISFVLDIMGGWMWN